MVLEFLEYTGYPESLDVNSRVVGTNRLTPSLLLVLFLKAWLWSSMLPGSSEVCPRTWSPMLCRVWAEQIHCSQKSPFHKQWSQPGRNQKRSTPGEAGHADCRPNQLMTEEVNRNKRQERRKASYLTAKTQRHILGLTSLQRRKYIQPWDSKER